MPPSRRGWRDADTACSRPSVACRRTSTLQSRVRPSLHFHAWRACTSKSAPPQSKASQSAPSLSAPSQSALSQTVPSQSAPSQSAPSQSAPSQSYGWRCRPEQPCLCRAVQASASHSRKTERTSGPRRRRLRLLRPQQSDPPRRTAPTWSDRPCPSKLTLPSSPVCKVNTEFPSALPSAFLTVLAPVITSPYRQISAEARRCACAVTIMP